MLPLCLEMGLGKPVHLGITLVCLFLIMFVLLGKAFAFAFHARRYWDTTTYQVLLHPNYLGKDEDVKQTEMLFTQYNNGTFTFVCGGRRRRVIQSDLIIN